MKYLKREKYLSKIRNYYNKQLIKALVGQRRVGKSVLLKQIMDDIKSKQASANIIFINKEDLAFDNIKTYKELDNYIKLKSTAGQNYIFIDEVQEISEFEKALRSYIAKENYDIYITGSNARLLSSELATLLTGRQILFRIHPLSYSEFLQINNLQNDETSLLLYLKYGGLPYIANLQLTDEIVFEYLSNVLNTILFRDVVNRYKVRDSQFLWDLVTFLSSITGHLISVKKLQGFLTSKGRKKSVNTIMEYLQYLENAFLINKVKRYNIKGKQVFEIGYKYYFEDIGIRNVTRGFIEDDIEKIVENAVYSHLKNLGYDVYIGTINDKEIDFVAVNHTGQRIYLQVAYKIDLEKTFKREVGNLLEIKDNHPKYIITTDKFLPLETELGIKHLYLGDFLLTETLNS